MKSRRVIICTLFKRLDQTMTTGKLPSGSFAVREDRENEGQLACHGGQKGRMRGGGTGNPLRDRTNFPNAAANTELSGGAQWLAVPETPPAGELLSRKPSSQAKPSQVSSRHELQQEKSQLTLSDTVSAETPDAYDHRQIPLCESKVSSDDDSYEGARPTSIEMVTNDSSGTDEPSLCVGMHQSCFMETTILIDCEQNHLQMPVGEVKGGWSTAAPLPFNTQHSRPGSNESAGSSENESEGHSAEAQVPVEASQLTQSSTTSLQSQVLEIGNQDTLQSELNKTRLETEARCEVETKVGRFEEERKVEISQ